VAGEPLYGRQVDAGAQREVVAQVAESVEPVRIGRGVYEARLTWTPLGEFLGRLRDALAQAEAA
jgi:hypothetical protein